MSQKTKNYRELLAKSNAAQDAGDDELSEQYLTELDALWLSMSAEEVAETELISQELARHAIQNP